MKFGRIECHESIIAFARDILLTAKQRLGVGGWGVVHGIVDSIWVTPYPDLDDDEGEDLETLASEITERVDIRLEHEAHYDWVAFVPQRESDAAPVAPNLAEHHLTKRRLVDGFLVEDLLQRLVDVDVQHRADDTFGESHLETL